MACVVVPMVEAVITTITTKVIESKEISANTHNSESEVSERLPFSRKLKWLNNLLWGGSALLFFEHVWHGEIAPFFPFLTAASDPGSLAEMLQEMSTAGVGMSLTVTAAWLGMVAVTSVIEKRSPKTQPSEN